MTERTVITGGQVITMDDELGTVKGDVLIEDGLVVAVGADLAHVDAHRIDASGSIVIPGLIDCHRHAWQSLIRSLTADWSLMNYLAGIRMQASTLFTAEDMYTAQLAAGLEALNAGVTTFVDYSHNIQTPDHAWEAIRGLRESGVRAVWSPGFNFPIGSANQFGDQGKKADFFREMASTAFSSSTGRLTLGCAPEEGGLAPPSELTEQFRYAREVGAHITLHVNSMRWHHYPQDVSLLNDLGLLGPDVLLVHMNASTDEEWRMAADSGAQVVFTPETELQMGMGLSPLERARKVGMRPALGVDIVSNNSGDMFFPMRLALQVERGRANQPQIDAAEVHDGVTVPAREALVWGTVNGAAAAGLADRVGRVAPGMAADIVLLDSTSIEMSGWATDDAAAHVVLQAHQGLVRTVLVDGEIVKENGVMRADVARAARQATESAHRIAQEAAERLGGFLPEDRGTILTGPR